MPAKRTRPPIWLQSLMEEMMKPPNFLQVKPPNGADNLWGQPRAPREPAHSNPHPTIDAQTADLRQSTNLPKEAAKGANGPAWESIFVSANYPTSLAKAYSWKIRRATRIINAIRIETDDGTYALKRTHIELDRIRFLRRLLSHVEHAGFSRYAKFVMTKTNQPFVQTDGQRYYATKWIDGAPVHFSSLQQVQQTAYALAQFYEASRGFETTGYHPPMVFDLVELTKERHTDLQRLKQIAERKTHKDSFDDLFLAHYEQWLIDAIESLRMISRSDVINHVQSEETKPGVCHLDVIPSNFIYTKENEVYLLDFDLSTYAPRALDLAHLLRRAQQQQNWSSEVAYHCFLQYDAVSPMTKAEYRLVQALMTFPYRAWRIAHTRYRVFIEESQFEELSSCVRQEPSRHAFLDAFRTQLTTNVSN